MTSTTATLTDAQQLGQEVYHLITNDHKGAALLAAKRGWRDFPEHVLTQTASGPMTFERLVVILSAELGEAAEPAAAEPVPAPAAQVSAPPQVYRPASLDNAAIPVSAVPVSAAPVSAAPVSAVPVIPVSAAPAPAGSAAIVIERTAEDGTIIRLHDSMPKLMPLIGSKARPDLGWRFAKRNFLYLGDRDTAPDMAKIAATLATLAQHGLLASSTVTGAEPARPVSAPPAAAPARRPAGSTRRQKARQASPVTVTYVQPVSAAPVAPVSAPVAPTFTTYTTPVSAPPAPAAAPIDPAIALMMEQMAAMQAQLAAMAGVAPAPVAAPVSAVPVSPATVSAEEALAMLVDTKRAEVLAKVEALTWQFRLADGASARHTAREMRQELAERVAGWWAHHHAGSVTFSVMVDKETPGVLHVKVNAAAGDITPSKLAEQVVGTILTVRGIKSRSTTKRDA